MTKNTIKKGGGTNVPINYSHTHVQSHSHGSKSFLKIKSFLSRNFKKIIIALVIIGLCVGGYFLYKNIKKTKDSLFKSKMLVELLHDGKKDKIIFNGKFPRVTSSNEYNLSMWIYVNDYSYRKMRDKCILFRGSLKEQTPKWDRAGGMKSNISNPSIWLMSKNNTLRIYTGLDTSFKNNKNEYCEIEYFPLQKWVHLNICLRNNIIDVYMDGKLHKSTILSGSPVVSAGDLYLCTLGSDNLKGFDGYLSKIEYSNLALSPNKIYDVYKKGPNIKLKKGFFDKIFSKFK